MSQTRKIPVGRLRDTVRAIAVVMGVSVPSMVVYSQIAGCSSSSNGGATLVPPGGTLGALVTIHVQGGGRVYAEPGGVDCPGSCAHSFIFDPGTDGASNGIKLTAEGSSTWAFAGYTFNTVAVASRGEGPSECQPISRQTSDAPSGVDTKSPTLTLTPSEVSGTSQAEAGAFCSSYTKVPAAYDITAKFVSTSLVEGGVDGGDGGLVDMIYDRPTTNAIGRRIFLTSSNQLLWQTDDGAQSTISYGAASGFSHGIVTTTSLIQKFWGTSTGAAYQTSGTLYGIFSPYTSTVFFTGAPTCSGLAADSSYAYCMGNDGTFTRWSRFSPSIALPLDTSIFNVTGLDDDTGQTFSVYSDSSGNVSRVSNTGYDGGTPMADAGLIQVATGQSSPREVHVANGTVYYINNNSQLVSATASGGGIVTSIGTSHFGMTSFAVDPFGSFIIAAIVPSQGVGQSSIIMTALPSGVTTTTIRAGLTGVGGVATDGNYVYWTDITGRAFKALAQ